MSICVTRLTLERCPNLGDAQFSEAYFEWFNTHVQDVDETHRCFDPTHFVLQFPYGTDGWCLNMRKRPSTHPPKHGGTIYSFWDAKAGRWTNADGVVCPIRPPPKAKNEHQLSTRAFYCYRLARPSYIALITARI